MHIAIFAPNQMDSHGDGLVEAVLQSNHHRAGPDVLVAQRRSADALAVEQHPGVVRHRCQMDGRRAEHDARTDAAGKPVGEYHQAKQAGDQTPIATPWFPAGEYPRERFGAALREPRASLVSVVLGYRWYGKRRLQFADCSVILARNHPQMRNRDERCGWRLGHGHQYADGPAKRHGDVEDGRRQADGHVVRERKVPWNSKTAKWMATTYRGSSTSANRCPSRLSSPRPWKAMRSAVA